MKMPCRWIAIAGSTLVATMATAAEYKIDPSQGHLIVRTFKAGPAARLAHDHVIHAGRFGGTVVFEDAPEKCSIRIELPTDSLVADDANQRKKFGLNPISAGDAKDINENMRDEDQLNVAKFRTMSFESTAVTRSGDTYSVKGKLTLHGVTREITIPVKASVTGDTFHGSGEVKVKQSDFGITPYSAALGMVKNADEITLVLDVYAKGPPPAAAAPAPAAAPADAAAPAAAEPAKK